MDEKRTDLGHHVGSKRLVAYREGKLPPEESEAVQEHLSLCSRCTGLLLELRDFEEAAVRGEAGPESLRQEAWESLVQRLPSKTPVVRPIALPGTPQRRLSRFVLSAAAALLLAVLGFAVWAMVTAQQERQRRQDRDATITALRGTLADAERQLGAARRQIQDLERNRSTVDPAQPASRVQELETRVAELTAALEELRRSQPTQEQTVIASREIEISVSPRFAVRGQENPGSPLRGGGVVNSLRLAPQADRFTVTLSLDDHPVYNEYRLELMNQDGEILWSARRPGKSLLGDAGTRISVNGLNPGVYRLRIESLYPERSELLSEYLLRVEQ